MSTIEGWDLSHSRRTWTRGLAAFVLWLAGAGATCPAQALPAAGAGRGEVEQAARLAQIGAYDLHLGRVGEAQTNCDAALKLDPANGPAKSCLQTASRMLIDQDLNNADAKLLSGDKAGAIALASRWSGGGAAPPQQARARAIVRQARPTEIGAIVKLLAPDWLRQLLLTLVTLTAVLLLLIAARKLWREWKRGEWYGNLNNTTRWNMVPLKELPAGESTGIATDSVLDALARLGHELQQPLWKPRLLLLRPTPPANYEPAILSDFLSDALPEIVIAPEADDLRVEWKLHDVQLDEAVQSLQLKTGTGLDIGSVARLLRSIVEWFNAGAPGIAGVARVGADKSVSIHLAAHGGRIRSAAVTASTDAAPGIDATELSAERAAFKFLFRMRYPDMTNDQIDGFSALRQGATLFGQYAGTVPGVGEDAKARTSSLAKAAFNLSFFRASIPAHCNLGCGRDRASLQVTDPVRQAVLLAEGVAHALVGTAEERMSAIDCFRQLQDWPGSAETEALRHQAAYNEAIVWAQSGNVARAVLMLTELLGQRAPDTIAPEGDDTVSSPPKRGPLPDSIRLPARVARVAEFARYDRDAFSVVPSCRVALIADDAEGLVKDLDLACKHGAASARDHRLLQYMYVESLRAIGHIELLRVVYTHAARLYENKRPTGLRHAGLDEEGAAAVHRAIVYMLSCEQLSPSGDLYCDLAEAYLLLKNFTAAQGYARHAILESDAGNEWAFYLAAETYLLENTERSLELARTYSEKFQGTVKLEEFKGVREELAAAPAPGPRPLVQAAGATMTAAGG